MHIAFMHTHPRGEGEERLNDAAHRGIGEVSLQIKMSVRFTLLALLVDEEDRDELAGVGGGAPLDEPLLGLETGRLLEALAAEVLERNTSYVLLGHFGMMSCPVGRFFLT